MLLFMDLTQRGGQDEGLREAQMLIYETSQLPDSAHSDLGQGHGASPLSPGPSSPKWGSKDAHHTNLTGLD